MSSADKFAFFPYRLYQRWLNRRLPPRRVITLNRSNVFIFPSRAGFAFLFLAALLWLIATNYENNLVFMLTFLLISVFVVSVLHTYSNLAGIRLTAVRSKPAFVGEDAEFECLLEKNNHRRYENLLLNWRGMSPRIVNLTDQQQATIKLYQTSKQRGWLHPGRLLVQTYYPLGLIRAWTWLDLDTRSLVYPKPIKTGPVPFSPGSTGEGNTDIKIGTDDFQGLRDYQPGESLRHVAWKQYAKAQGLYTKEYTTSTDRKIWLDWDFLAGMDTESRLSRLCYWVLEADKTGEEYGLRLPQLTIEPATGIDHREQMLKALALFGLS